MSVVPAKAPRDADEPGVVPARYWHPIEGGKIQCDLCPRNCQVGPGQRAFCFVRQNRGGQMVLTTYGRASGFCIDPIEKKPLAHFYPGSSVLSFGTAGCNLGCRFCQNWDISKAKENDRLTDLASPEAIADAAVRAGCRSVAFTYNDPVIFAEFAMDTARACRAVGVRTVAVTAGYISEPARTEFYELMDAANVDLKAFSETFYHKLCFAHLAPVLDTLRAVHREHATWLEITTLLIPGDNDSDDEIQRLSGWIVENLGVEVPLHFTAFHPDFKLLDRPRTPMATCAHARSLALAAGLKHVYTGNVHDPEGQSTCCAACGALLVARDGYEIGAWHLDASGACPACGHRLAGHFDSRPGHWGARRQPVSLGRTAR